MPGGMQVPHGSIDAPCVGRPDLLAFIALELGASCVVGTGRFPGVAVASFLFGEDVGTDMDIETGVAGQSSTVDAVAREARQISRVDLHDAQVFRAVCIDMDGVGTQMRLDAGVRDQFRRIDVIAG